MRLQALSVDVRHTGDVWEGVARLVFSGRKKPVEVRVKVDEGAIREALFERVLARRMIQEDGAAAGFGFLKKAAKKLGKLANKATGGLAGKFVGKVKSTAKKIARAKVWKKIGNGVVKTLKSPAFAAAIGIASTAFPAIAPVYAGVRAAIALAERVKKGDAKALKNVAELAKSAAGNNPLAAQAVEALKAAEQSPLAQFIPAVI